MAVFVTGGGVVPSIGDENTTFLLLGNTVNDSSIYKNAITNAGVVSQTQITKFGQGSLYFNGSARLQIQNPNVLNHAGDFTIDWYQYVSSAYEQGAVFSQSTDGKGFGTLCGYGGSGNLGLYLANNQNWTIASTNAFGSQPIGSWHHYAVVKNGNQILCFKDGNQTYSSAFSGTVYGDNSPYLGYYDYSQGPSYMTGYLENFRISNIARWTSNFTPPAEPY